MIIVTLSLHSNTTLNTSKFGSVHVSFRFLHDLGVPADNLGWWLTVNPYIFKENLDNLQARINYLESMKFSSDQIARVILKNPYWLLFR